MKTDCRPSMPFRSPSREQGVALVVALILLVIMTLLGLGAMRTSTLEEKMAANTFDRSLSFQSTETALRDAEALLDGAAPPTPAPGSGCASGVCSTPLANAKPRWQDSTFTGWQTTTAVVSGSISITPQYFIEYLGNTFPCRPGDPLTTFDCKRYRVTARSNAGSDRASVMLQSIYATE